MFFLPDPDRALAEFHRVLRPGGRVAISSWASRNDPRYEWYGELRREFGVSVSLETRAFETADELLGALAAAGFVGAAISSERVALRLDGPQDWWRWLNSIGARAAVEALAPEERERFRLAAFQRIHDTYADGVVEVEDEALFAVAQKPR
jgi:SAM-dependent methyltransferase